MVNSSPVDQLTAREREVLPLLTATSGGRWPRRPAPGGPSAPTYRASPPCWRCSAPTCKRMRRPAKPRASRRRRALAREVGYPRLSPTLPPSPPVRNLTPAATAPGGILLADLAVPVAPNRRPVGRLAAQAAVVHPPVRHIAPPPSASCWGQRECTYDDSVMPPATTIGIVGQEASTMREPTPRRDAEHTQRVMQEERVRTLRREERRLGAPPQRGAPASRLRPSGACSAAVQGGAMAVHDRQYTGTGDGPLSPCGTPIAVLAHTSRVVLHVWLHCRCPGAVGSGWRTTTARTGRGSLDPDGAGAFARGLGRRADCALGVEDHYVGVAVRAGTDRHGLVRAPTGTRS